MGEGQQTLFEMAARLLVDPAMSPDRRRTLRRRQLIDAGIHPLMGTRTRPELGTCGDCERLLRLDYHGRSYLKCGLVPLTHGAGTDVRAWWPACGQHVRTWPEVAG